MASAMTAMTANRENVTSMSETGDATKGIGQKEHFYSRLDPKGLSAYRDIFGSTVNGVYCILT